MDNVKIEINSGEFKVDKNFVKNAVQDTIRELQSNGGLETEQEVEISVAVVSKSKIKEINKKWRNKDKKTDVLSFCYENTDTKLEGEVVLCLDIIKENAQEDGIKIEEELRKNIIHSILHITGYQHGEEMFKLQDKILEEKLT